MNQKKILVIDDEVFIRELVKDFLELENIQCDEASDMNTTRESLSKNRYDLILLDRNLGNSRAEDIIKEMREIKGDTQVVILTGDHMCDENYLKKIEANGIIFKPFQVDEFLKKINIYLNIK